MSVGTYLRSHAYVMVIACALAVLVAMVAYACGVGSQATWLLVILVLGAGALTLAAGCVRCRRFYDDLARLVSVLDEPMLVSQLIEEPTFAEGRVVLDALRSVCKSAGDEVAEAGRQASDYRSYIETWVHEAKSPLAAASLALDNLRADGSIDARSAMTLSSELRRVDGYVEQALFVARSEALERDYLIRRHGLRGLVAAAIKANAPELIGAGIAPRLGEGLELAVFCDGKWLGFILGQLVHNSVRYVRPDAEGGPAISFSAQLLDEGSADERVELTVADNGCGCPAADLPRVFDRGFTGENGRAHKHSTGLGLWLVATLCEKMGLSVHATSAEGEGFAVTIVFPANKMHYFE